MLRESSGVLVEHYDLVALDLDGVVYVGAKAVPNAALALAEASTTSRIAFVTNNASRTPREVATHLTSLGITADEDDVVTSAQAAATLLRDMLSRGSRVFVVGGRGLEVALEESGLVPVFDADDGVDAVVQGYGPQMPWSRVVLGAILVKEGRPWVVSNMDRTIPTEQGIGPGNGALVNLVADYSGREPIVAGKPEPPLLHEVERRGRADRPLFVGDRLDTDMAGGHNVGWPSLLVRTGVTTLRDLVEAPPNERPSFISYDLRGLLTPHPVPHQEGSSWVLGGWRAFVEADRLQVEGRGSDDDWWRCAAVASWAHRDQARSCPQAASVKVDHLRPPR